MVARAPAPILFVAPVGRDVGLTSMTLGLVRAFERDGLRVGFAKPIAQRESGALPDLSTHFARQLLRLEAPTPIPQEHAEALLRQGDMDSLMEQVVTQVDEMRQRHDLVVVEGLVSTGDVLIARGLNAAMIQSLGADLLFVGNAGEHPPAAIAESLQLALHTQPGGNPAPLVGLLLNKVSDRQHSERLRSELSAIAPVLAVVPYRKRLAAPRLADMANELKLRVANAGRLAHARVQEIVIGAGTVEHLAKRLGPDVLVVTPGDRSDLILAVALAALRDMPLAGLLLTGGIEMDEDIARLVHSAELAGLTVLGTRLDTLDAALRLTSFSTQVRADDLQRMGEVIEFIAEQTDTRPLQRTLALPRERRLSPPAFRHLLLTRASRAAKRIVLPEGDEPRTVQAASVCQRKGIARCVLLGNRERILQVADAQGLRLSEDIQIIEPAEVRARYIAPMVELRSAKGLTAPQAEALLEDNVVLGTMMLALGEVDGLVSGAVHTTASTVRPALQLIKTAPRASLVSSVFFMLLPEQVLVYGDCAINPDPTAEQLAEIAIQSADSARAFGLEPRVAMISYATGGSGEGADVDKVREATRLARARRPELIIDGPLQYDAASVASVGQQKAPDSPVAGRANVFVFPDLNTGNTTYKAVQRSARVVSVGPMLQGLRKPVNDLSRGALVDDIVYTIALTAIQAAQTPAGDAGR